MAGEMTIEILDDFANAWNEHDLEKLMSHMTQDCVFELSAGSEAWGARFEGYDNVYVRATSACSTCSPTGSGPSRATSSRATAA